MVTSGHGAAGGFALRSAVALALLLSAPLLAPATAADEPPLAIGLPRIGDEATYDYAWYRGGALLHGPYLDALRWTSPAIEVREGYGVVHRAYAVEWCHSAPPCGFQLRVDLDTRDVLASEWPEKFESALLPPPLPPVTSTSSDLDERHMQAYSSWRWGLQGMTLAPGDAGSRQAPVSPVNPNVVADTAWLAHGWESKEDRTLFRVDLLEARFGGWMRLWYDGDAPLPAIAERDESDGDVIRWTLTSFTRGDGDLLDDPSYVAPGYRTTNPDFARHVYTEDGPGEPLLAAFPLQDAVRAAHLSPLIVEFLGRHPDAYVTEGWGGAASWTIFFADAEASRWATVHRVVPGTLPVDLAVDVSTQDGPGLRHWRPAAEAAAPFACGDAMLPALEAAGESAAPSFALFDLHFSREGEPILGCVGQASAAGSSGSARIDGATGGVDTLRWSTSRTTTGI